MRLLFFVLLVIVCIECGRRNGKKSKGGEKNRNEAPKDYDETITLDDAVEEELQEVEEEEELEEAVCTYQTRFGELTLGPGTTYQFNMMDQCEVVQCLEGGIVEKTRIPVNKYSHDYSLHEFRIYNPMGNGMFGGKSCKACLCIDGRNGMFFLSCQDFADSCKDPVNGVS